MRLPSSAILRRAAAMSSSSYGRRGYPRRGRGYSARPTRPPHLDAGAEFVSGDSHVSAVRAANDSLRRGGGPPMPYRQGPHQQPPYGYSYGYGYGYGQPQQPASIYGAVPYNYGHPQQQPSLPGPQQYGYGAPNPYFHGHPHLQPHGRAPGNSGFHPGAPQLTPRLADYRRRWRHAKQRPPHQAERFTVLSYNILADYLAQEHQFLYERVPKFMLNWNWRKEKLVFEFGLWNPDILCLQEVDKFTDLEQELARREYRGIWKMRTGNAVDGCAIFWRTTRFQLCYEEDIEFNKLGLRDNVAQICVLETVVAGNAQTDSDSHSHPQQAKQIVVCNTHVLYNPKRGDIKLGQVRALLERAYVVSKLWNNAPVILCGDFNSTPKSPLYNFVSEKKLNLSSLAKSTISGQQTSASPQRLYTGFKLSQSHPSFNTTNSKEGKRALPNGKDCDTSDADACANEIGGEEGTPIHKSSEECTGMIKAESGEEPEVTGVPSAQATLCGEVLQSDSSKILPEENGAQSDVAVSKHNPDEKDKALESLLPGQDNCTTTEPESCSASASQSVTYACHQMSNMRLEEETSTEASHLESPEEPVHQSNGSVPDASCCHCTSGAIDKHSVSSGHELEDSTSALEDERIASEVLCSDVNSDPTFFEELTGVKDSLLEEEDQLPAISDGSSSQQMVTSNGSYYFYDPYKWTPDEIRTATGKDECTYVEHNLKLRSTYTDIEDFEGTKDANKEPLVTSYNSKFMGTVDYIWVSEELQTVRVLDTFPKEILKQTSGFPTKKWGSDHIALVCELAFTK